MRARGRGWLWGGAGVALVVACAQPKDLSGSVGELFSLQFAKVELLRNPEAFQVNYYNNRGIDVDLVIRLTVATEGIEFRPGKAIPLQGEYAEGHPRTTVLHMAGGEPARTFPRVERGDMNLDEPAEAGKHCAGNFSLVFEKNNEFGSGRTLAGNFSGTVLDAGFGP